MKTGKEKLATIVNSIKTGHCVSIAKLVAYSGLSAKSVHMHISWNNFGPTKDGFLKVTPGYAVVKYL